MAWKFMSIIMSLLGAVEQYSFVAGSILFSGRGRTDMSSVTLVRVRSESEEVFTNPLCEEEFVIQITSALCNPSESSHSI